jgi:hypothetical protein
MPIPFDTLDEIEREYRYELMEEVGKSVVVTLRCRLIGVGSKTVFLEMTAFDGERIQFNPDPRTIKEIERT